MRAAKAFLFAALLSGAIVLAVVLLAGCAHIDGTDIARPPLGHEGYTQYGCWPVDESGLNACCWYTRDDYWQLVCTRDGGDTWDLLTEPRASLDDCDDWRRGEECREV